jgi:ribosome-associated toxin RatA of RatAB toxin-antitoxin module
VKSVRRSARVPYTAAQMFDLVNDVEAYPEFLPWCQDASIDHASTDKLEATLSVGLGGVSKRFSTRNRLERPRRIDIELVSGPFRRLEGHWQFDEVAGQGCDISVALDFDVAAMPLKIVFERLFEEVARSQMNAFITRAQAIYG